MKEPCNDLGTALVYEGMDYKHRDRILKLPEFNLWTPEGLRAAYAWLTVEEARYDSETEADCEPLTEAELEALLREIMDLKPSPLPPDIERLGKPGLDEEAC